MVQVKENLGNPMKGTQERCTRLSRLHKISTDYLPVVCHIAAGSARNFRPLWELPREAVSLWGISEMPALVRGGSCWGQ